MTQDAKQQASAEVSNKAIAPSEEYTTIVECIISH